MNKKRFIIICFLLLFTTTTACKKDEFDENGYQTIQNEDYISNQDESAEVKNLILLIGDGMGANQVEVARMMLDINKFDLDSYEYKSMVDTNCLNNYVTDSAASATAMATGVRTLYERLGKDEEGNELKTILDYAKENGKKIGIVTDEPLNDATPAAFSAHLNNRYVDTLEQSIVKQQIASNIDVLFGLGAKDFYPQTTMIESWGWEFVTTKEDFNKTTTSKVLAAFSEASDADIPTLFEMTNKAIKILDNEEGFVLIVECGKIDGACNYGDVEELANSVSMLDKTLRVILNFMRSNQNTTVIVTGDHETGGIVLKEGVPSIDWFTEKSTLSEGSFYHTAVNVPLYAFGTRSKIFENKEIKNSDIFDYMMELLGFNK